jgi:hypothetical protein
MTFSQELQNDPHFFNQLVFNSSRSSHIKRMHSSSSFVSDRLKSLPLLPALLLLIQYVKDTTNVLVMETDVSLFGESQG